MAVRKPASPNKRRPQKQSSVPKQESTFLLEVGIEELPSAFLPVALQDLERLAQEMFENCRLRVASFQAFGTPRRLALMVQGVDLKQASLVEEVFGPPKTAAFDPSGKPTKAAEGFAKSQGVPVDSLIVKETAKGLYVCIEKYQKGQPAKRVLADAIPQLLGKVHFPKAMRWNASQVRFARPVRWIIAMLGKEALSFEFAGIRSGQRTWGHRYPRNKTRTAGAGLKIPQASRYLDTMIKAGVVVDPQERRKLVDAQVNKLARSAKGDIDPETRQELIEAAVCGVESPHAIMGTFHPEFLSIPKPVLISSMKEHQGFFSLIDQQGRLLPKFIAVTNMPWGNIRLMTKGNERVLAARLKDAQHFFREDVKRPLEERVTDLHHIVFHQKVGTVYQKVERVKTLVGWLAERVGRPELKAECERAAWLCKADLTTGMVDEFPTLQGVMGEEYARYAREPLAVCQAIGSQYFPRFPDDRLPASLPGVLLALVDRCDSLASFFSVGMVPTGSEDPLGLRRAAYGLVRLVTETPLRLNMVEVFARCLEELRIQGVAVKTADPVQESVAFIIDRFRFFAKQSLNLRDEVMESVTHLRQADHCDLFDLFIRMRALQSMALRTDFEPLMTGFKRAHRIVEKEQWVETSVDPDRFVHESEHTVLHALGFVRRTVAEAIALQEYEKALQALLELKLPIDQFFEAVLVNDDDPQVRANRLSLLKVIDQVFLQLADFSCLPSSG
ncbi:MAG: glycine--tRNA ligase subunit beta [Nitrospirales bacterium]|nr:glycine--tRNA ligase subunit beta [Nitrospirales bacterium]